jgi:pimeloyl-ACP methyl ester carboxylesterase
MNVLQRVRRVLASTLVIATIVLAAYWTFMFFVQRSLMYPRPPVAAGLSRPTDVQQVWIATPGGRVEAWYLPPVGAIRAAAPLLLFTHGNGELIDFWADAFAELPQWGVGVLLLEYPGYGRSEGVPSAASITAAIVGAYDWARTQPGIDPRRVVAYGRSLGGGAACALAARREVAALILESSFTSVADLARGFAVPGFLVRDRFDNLAVARAYGGPLLVLHGSQDEVIPVSHGRSLAAANPHSEFHLLPCGHNDCARPWPLIREFLSRHGLLDAAGGTSFSRT